MSRRLPPHYGHPLIIRRDGVHSLFDNVRRRKWKCSAPPHRPPQNGLWMSTPRPLTLLALQARHTARQNIALGLALTGSPWRKQTMDDPFVISPRAPVFVHDPSIGFPSSSAAPSLPHVSSCTPWNLHISCGTYELLNFPSVAIGPQAVVPLFFHGPI